MKFIRLCVPCPVRNIRRQIKGVIALSFSNFLMLVLTGLIVFVVSLFGCALNPLPSPFPASPDFKSAEENFLNGNYNEAIGFYQRFIASQKEERTDYTAEANYRIGVSFLALGNHAEAEKYLTIALKNPAHANRSSFYAQAYQALGQVCQAQDKYKQAVYNFRKAVKYNNGELPLGYLYYNLGVCLMRNDIYSEGKEFMEMSLKNTDVQSDEKLREHALERLAAPPHTFTVQLGKFKSKENAYNYQQELRQEKAVPAVVNIILIDGKEFYYVWSGRYDTFEQAQAEADKINDKGIEAVVVP